jgi:hypothetical protein
MQGQSYELSKGAESEREKILKDPAQQLNTNRRNISVTYKV